MKGKQRILRRLIAITLSLTMVLGMIIQPVQVSAAGLSNTLKTGEEPASLGETEQEGDNNQLTPPGNQTGYEVKVTGPTTTSGKPGDVISGFSASVTENGQSVTDAVVTWKASQGVTVDTSKGVSVTIPTDLTDGAKFEVWANYEGQDSNKVAITVERPKITVSGKIIDSFKDNGEIPLKGAQITLVANGADTTTYSATSKEDGTYSISGVTAGLGVSFNLAVTKDGYNQGIVNISESNTDVTEAVELETNETIQISSSTNTVSIFDSLTITATTDLTDDIKWTVNQTEEVVTYAQDETGKEFVLTGNAAGTATVTASTHGVKSNSYTITVNKRNTKGSIEFFRNGEALSEKNMAIAGDELSIGLSLEDKKISGANVKTSIENPTGTEEQLAQTTVGDNGKAEIKYTAKYEGSYFVKCEITNKNFETLTIESQFNVDGKAGQEIKLDKFDEENAATYGDTRGVSYGFTALVAVENEDDVKNEKHWTIKAEKNNDEYAPQINFNNVEQDKDNPDLWKVEGIIFFKAAYAGDVTITVKYSQDATAKVYKDAEISETYSIKKKELTVTGITFNEKIYDGTSDANVNAITLEGIINQDNVEAVITGLKLAGKNADEEEGYCLNTDPDKGGQPLTLTGDKADNYTIKRSEDDAAATTKCKIQRRPLYLKVNDLGDQGELLERQYGYPGIYENGAPTIRVATDEELKDIIADTEHVGEIDNGDAGIRTIEVKDYSSIKQVVDEATAPDENLEKRLKPDLDNEASISDKRGAKNYKYVASESLYGTVRIIPNKTVKADTYLICSSTNGSIFTDHEKGLWVRGNVEVENGGYAYDLTLGLNGKAEIPFDAIKVVGAAEGSDENVTVIVPQDNNKETVQIKFVVPEEQKKIAKVELILLTKNSAEQLVECSKPFVLTANVDAKAPVVSFDKDKVIGESNLVDKLVSAITFNRYKKTNYTMEVSFNDEEGSGVRANTPWKYYVLPITDNMQTDEYSLQKAMDGISDKQWIAAKDGQTSIPIGKFDEEIDEKYIEGHYIVAVKSYDNVNNSRIYTSNGLVLEDNRPEITFKENPKTYYNLEDMKKSSNEFTLENIEISDIAKDGDVSSAIKEISYQVYKGGTKDSNMDDSEVEKLIPYSEDTVLYKAEKDGYLYSELQKDSEFTKITEKVSFVIDEKFDGNDVFLRVTATDNAGNEHYNTMPLRFDLSRPEIEVTYKNVGETAVHNENYYDGNRTATIKFSDRNVDMDQAIFTVSLKDKKYEQDIVLNEESIAILEELKDIYGNNIFKNVGIDMDEGTGQDEDIHVSTVTLEFNGNEQYTVDYKCTDLAGNKNSGKLNTTFTIDKIAPVVTQLYTVDGQEISMVSKAYSQKPMFYSVNIAEHNFKADTLPFEADSKTVITEEVDEEKESNPDKMMEDVNQWTENGNLNNTEQWKFAFNFTEQGNYTHSFDYKDLAGNDAVFVDVHGNTISNKSVFTIDWTPANATITVGSFNPWKNWLGDIFFKLFSKSSVDVSIEAQDDICDIYPLEYARFHNPQTVEQLNAYNTWQSASKENPGYTKFSVNTDEKFVVYTKVTDYAGNMKYYSSDGVIVDSTNPEPTVIITNLSQSQNGIFNENVTLQIDVKDPIVNDSYAGLEKVWYTVSATGNVNVSETIELMNNSNSRMQSHQTFTGTITVPADVYNSNDVKVQAFATDFAGNQGDSEVTELKIDVTNPTISVSWDLNNPLNGRYYKDTRTATVTVTDRNFDPNNVRFSITNTDGTSANIGGWSSSSNIGVSDNATSTCQVSFPADGDYTFTLGCTDLAGNSGEYGQTDEFTIDKTLPEMTVSYDNNDARNGNYFKEARTATVTIREHNFNAADVRAAITASLEGKGVSTPSIGAFSGSGDTHTASVSYSTDGDYTFDIDYTDMAGNAAADYTQDSFTVDLTAPELEITDVEDKSANNDAVSPKVEAKDVNYDAKGVTITLTGANNGQVEVGTVVSAIQNGQSMKFNDFARTEEMDDLYKLTAKVVDKAGNETEKEIMFSVNRYGSIFVLDDDTKDWLMTDDGYTYIREEKEVGIREINVDNIESRSITVNRDGELASLKENTGFTVKTSGSEAQWKEAHYTIAKENFAREGNYTVILNTQDEAQNSMNNTSVKKANKNLPIEFAVDKTAPTVVVSGVENDAQYRLAEKTMTVDAKDNLALAKVAINIDGTEKVYEGEELMKDNGVIEAAIASANRWQSIEITAEDAAGNVLGQSEQKLEGEPVVLRILVTPNIVIQYYMNKPLFYGSIAAVVVMLGLIVFLVWRKMVRKKKIKNNF